MRYCLILMLLTWLLPKAGYAQDHLKDNQYHYRFYNGLDIYFLEEQADPLITLSITFRMGVFADRDTLHGLSYQFYKAYSKSLAAWAKERRIAYRDSFQVERTVHIFQFPPSMMEKTLNDLSIKLSAPVTINAADLATTIPLAKGYDSLPAAFSERGQQLLWGDYYLRTTLLSDSLPTDTVLIKKVHDIYYCAGNAVVVIRGNFTSHVLYPLMQLSMAGWKECAHNPFLENPIPYPKDNQFSEQIVEENPAYGQPQFVLWMRGPASRQDKEYYLLAPLMEETFKDASMTKVFMDSSHITDLKLKFENNRYASVIRITMRPDTARADSAYVNIFRFLRYAGDGRIFNAGDMEKAKETLIERFEKAEKDPIEQANLFATYWLNSDVNDYSLMTEKIKAVNVEQLCTFVHKYLQNQPFVAGLIIDKDKRAAMKTDTFFAPTYPIEKYKVVFTKNNAFIADSTRDSIVRSLAQVIKINPGMKVLVNGVASKNELFYVTDETMIDFLKQHPAFTITPDNLIPTKKIRLDVYRSLQVVKALIELGVPEKQLLGTGKVVEQGTMSPDPDQLTFCTTTIY